MRCVVFVQFILVRPVTPPRTLTIPTQPTDTDARVSRPVKSRSYRRSMDTGQSPWPQAWAAALAVWQHPFCWRTGQRELRRLGGPMLKRTRNVFVPIAAKSLMTARRPRSKSGRKISLRRAITIHANYTATAAATCRCHGNAGAVANPPIMSGIAVRWIVYGSVVLQSPVWVESFDFWETDEGLGQWPPDFSREKYNTVDEKLGEIWLTTFSHKRLVVIKR